MLSIFSGLSPYGSNVTEVYEVWEFSTIDGGGWAVVRRPHCPAARHTTAERQGAELGHGWHGRKLVVLDFSVENVMARYRAEWSAAVDIRPCDCCARSLRMMMTGVWPAPASGKIVSPPDAD